LRQSRYCRSTLNRTFAWCIVFGLSPVGFASKGGFACGLIQ
jgi:hypothetical protein